MNWIKHTWDQNPFVVLGIAAAPIFPALAYMVHGDGFWLSNLIFGLIAFTLWWAGIGLSLVAALWLYDRARKRYMDKEGRLYRFAETWSGKAWFVVAVLTFLLLSFLLDHVFKAVPLLGDPIRYIQSLPESSAPYEQWIR